MDKQRLIPLIVATALFMENMDSTVIATSPPAIAADIRTSPRTRQLASTASLLSLVFSDQRPDRSARHFPRAEIHRPDQERGSRAVRSLRPRARRHWASRHRLRPLRGWPQPVAVDGGRSPRRHRLDLDDALH